MTWEFKMPGLWVWKGRMGKEMVQLSLTEVKDVARFWTMFYSGYRVDSKTHDRALKANKIVVRHMRELLKELEESNLIIPIENIPEDLRARSERQCEANWDEYWDLSYSR